MKELVIAGFADGQSAFLARAALFRMQKQLSLGSNEIALVIREANDGVSLLQAVDLSGRFPTREVFWGTLSKLLFDSTAVTDSFDDDGANRLAAIGVDVAFALRASEIFQNGSAALLVLVRQPPSRDGALAVLRGFAAQLASTTLVSDELST